MCALMASPSSAAAPRQAVILAGGFGTRLRPFTCTRPKPVLPLCNLPFLAYQIDLLRRHGVEEVILATGYQPDAVREVFGDGEGRGVRITYSVEPKPLDTGGAIKHAAPLLGREPRQGGGVD